jgi:hypothetical protein
MIREVVLTVLEDEGYADVACLTPLHAMAPLQQVNFDLVITVGFSTKPGAVFVTTADVIQSAGVTPVALFSGQPPARSSPERLASTTRSPSPSASPPSYIRSRRSLTDC